MSAAVQYIVDGAVSTFWSRVKSSKTTYVVLAFVLAQAESLFQGGWQDPNAWRNTAVVAFGGAALIMIRSAQVKAELAANASNPDVSHVSAEPKF